MNSLRHVLPNGERTQYRQLNAEELRREFPQATFTNKHRGVLEKCAGILRADRCLEAVQSQFVSLGGTLKDGTAVTSLRKDGSRVRLELSGGAYITADKIAVCAGPWTAKAASDTTTSERLCSHVEHSSDPDDRDKMAPPGKTNRIANYINKRFPGLEQEPSIVETCMYTELVSKKHLKLEGFWYKC
ncbi:hypothetical protein B566_EDAN013672 [Ephemera danica]|nr:hypothetical protein B566_EDAN013672 [Ephemera danica]